MNFLEIELAFLEGLALIISPCILPILPLVLAASVEGGRRRPFGIITGFVLAFTAFAMLSRRIVADLGINLDIIKYGSLVLLALFGLILLSEKLSTAFSRATEGFANLGSNLTANLQGGFFSGIFIGMLIGLIWTPCAGPILAAVLVQIIRQESDAQALFLVGSFALGAGVPMLIIALTGRKLVARLKFLTANAEKIRKAFGLLILAAVFFIASGEDPAALFAKKESSEIKTSAALQDALEHPYPAPEIVGIEGWLNSKPLKISALKGKVVLIDFWTYSCINCVRTLPYLTKWDEKYRSKGLVIIGVHAPEFEFEKKSRNVENALRAHGIKYAVALDNRLDTWSAFQNRYWPAHYLIDQTGKVVYTHFGEGNYAKTENNIRHLLGVNEGAEEIEERRKFNRAQTHETYLGHARAENFSSAEDLSGSKNFTLPESLDRDHWALGGKWRVDSERIVSKEAGAKLRLNFTAKKVFLVLGSSGKPVVVKLKLNEKPIPDITVAQHKIYELVNQESAKNGVLEITASSAGLEAYAFTFGN